MKVFGGKSVFGGIAIGKIHIYQKACKQVKRMHIQDPAGEMIRFSQAKEKANEQLAQLYEKALKEVGEANAAIFEIHQMMLEDADYLESIENIITNQMMNAEYAVATTGDNFSSMFAAMDDEYMQARSADIKDISERLLNNLTGEGKDSVDSDEAVIIVAQDLAPSETVQMDKEKVLSFVTTNGSVNSHSAILARTMGIPAIVNAGNEEKQEKDELLDGNFEGKLGVVDGFAGVIYVDPDEETLATLREKQNEDLQRKQLLQTLKGRENVTVDGRRIMLYANIGNLNDLGLALQNDAGGIGLFRSEFLYLEKEDYPTEEEQFAVYKKVAETMAGRTVIIRTLDIGADKQCEYFHLAKEENPALGYRAIRICIDRPQVFKTQLRALFRASAFGNIAIMYPMITSLWEVKKIKEIVEEVKSELAEQGITFGNPKQGIMIETPAAVMMSEELAREVDFFSIGTNDLTQYTLAIDRQNQSLETFYDAHHPAVLRMIKMVIENAHKAGIWAGICGELGADTSLTRQFLEMGVDELSVSPGSVLPIRKIILETDLGQ